MQELAFKEANSASELEQIHLLNHRVFASELGQHAVRPSGFLIDSLHQQNRYFVALLCEVVIGMISVHGGPSFSISKRLPDCAVLSSFARPLEVRLLAIEPKARQRTVLAGLLWQVYDFAKENGFSHLLISGITERRKMYCKLGFRELGQLWRRGRQSLSPWCWTSAHGRTATMGESRNSGVTGIVLG